MSVFRNRGSRDWNKTLKWLVAVALVLLVAMVVLQMFFGGEGVLPVQILGALVGASLTAIITMFLLIGQTSSQENKDKAIQIHEQKIRVYSSFTSSLWETLADEKLEDEELRELRGKVFNELIFYLHPESISPFAETVTQICESQHDGEMAKLTEPFAKLTELLQDDLRKDAVDGDNVRSDAIQALWGAFVVAPAEDEKGELAEEGIQDEAVPSAGQDPEVLPQTWHFNVLDPKDQLDAFRGGVMELSLCEYGERWRTGLVEQVARGDIVFSFIPQKKGGYGYHGVFEVLGTRVIEKKDGVFIQRVNGEPQPIVAGESERYDVYSAFGDGATLVSNILVKPLAFSSGGVGNPGGVYRRTISRYWSGYAGKLLSLFSSLPQAPADWTEGVSFNADPDKIAHLARRFGEPK